MNIFLFLLLVPSLFNAIITEQILLLIILAFVYAILTFNYRTKDKFENILLIFVIVSFCAWLSTDLYFSKYVLVFSLAFYLNLKLLTVLKAKYNDCVKILLIMLGIFLIVQSTIFPGVSILKKVEKVASWDRTEWCDAKSYDDEIYIKSQYSYDILRKLINAESITNTHKLNEFSSLWVLTPTELFKSEEINDIYKWVLKGGKLIIVTDHTDIYGHARILSPLVKKFRMTINKDNVLDHKNVGGTYRLNFKELNGLSPNTFKGFGESWLTTWGYSERADYGGTNFFSDGQISDEENYSLWVIGLKRSFGLGNVTLFGDSTMFSNFALTRPSSQYILKKIFNDVSPIPYNLLAAISIFLYLFLNTISAKGKAIYCSLIILSLIYIILPTFKKERSLDFEGLKILNVSGDWNLIEPLSDHNPAAFRTFFASSYIASPCFPVWSGPNRKNSVIIFSNGKCLEGKTPEHPHFSDDEKLKKLLKVQTIVSLDDCFDEINKYAYASTYWFEGGIGPLNEYAYRLFWRDITGSSDKMKPYPILSNTSNVFYYVFTTNGYLKVDVEKSDIENYNGWKLLGDYIVAKEVKDGNLLIRKIWQRHPWQYKDMMLYKVNPHKNNPK